MAEVVTGALRTLLPKLTGLLTEEYYLQRGLRDEIMFLKAEMESLEAALIKISEAPIDEPPDIQVKLWAKAVRELSYDLEDSIDKFLVHTEIHDRIEISDCFIMGFIHKCLSLLSMVMTRREIGIDVKDINIRIREINKRRERYKVDSVPARPTGPSVDSLRRSTLYKNATELVGTDEKSLEVVGMLTEGGGATMKNLKVVSIVGLGGLGKTTLANAVYQKLKMRFDCTAFITVSLNPNMNTVLKSLLQKLEKQKYQNISEATWGEDQLISKIRECLEDKRYLIVIDDIWDTCVWENMKYALPENEHGSRVITTTRILDVAQQADGIYQLKPLSVVDSRKLFYQRIYETKNESPPRQLFEVSENILKRCDGAPLAIITIGSLLSSKNGRAHTHEYWSKVYNSMGSGLDNSHDDVKKMRRILSVSYSDLPPHLKTCLLHLSSYPEDSKIEVEQLIWKWVGEGCISKEHGRSLYEVGEDNFDELINKNLLQPVNFEDSDKVIFCRVHDMVHDLITSLSNEGNFLTTVGRQQQMDLPSKIRRLSIQTNINKVANELPTMSSSHVRSLTVSGGAFSLLPTLACFPVLRVLDLTDCRQLDDNHWNDICKLFHLRYLSLKGTSITRIPREIRNLTFLQVLDIRSTKIQEELPSTFIQLTQLLLVHMINSLVGAVPRWMCSMSTLFSLSITLKTLGEEDLQVLGSLPSLNELHIQVEEPTQGRDRLVVGSGYPFLCLSRFSVTSGTMQLKFAQGAMQNLQTLCLNFDDVDTLIEFGDFRLGLENLSSLGHIQATFNRYPEKTGVVTDAMRKEIEINQNKPKLKVKVEGARRSVQENIRVAIYVQQSARNFINASYKRTR